MNETVAAYRILVESPAWKDLLIEIEEIKQESVNDQDRVPTSEINVAVISECRGIRKGLDQLLRRVDEKVNG